MDIGKKYMQLCCKKNSSIVVLLIYINFHPPEIDFLRQIFGCL